ncbi:uncharacterized protein LOC126661707 [Mercurialis annua]|uniref:uncharacterized protein LOC126661707 n=1 Tax=Mercurialis annua TaxID=3986 RepID=UPI00215E97B2|nr:uncharacterized protein LOC126661707 [Mercurialis annua]
MKKHIENDYVIRFLKGLNENFGTIKSQILLMDPLPPVNKVFSLAVQHERQSNVAVLINIEPNVFYAKASTGNGILPNPYVGNAGHNAGNVGNAGSSNSGYMKKSFNTGQKKYYNQSGMKCTYCGLTNHTIDKCYRKHGYPPGFQSKSKQAMSYANQVESVTSENTDNMNAGMHNLTVDDNAMIQITPAEYESLKQQAQNFISSNQPQSHHLNTISTSFKPIPDETGKLRLICSVYTHLHKNTWIVDSGATDNIICSLSSFHTYKKVSNVFVHLPNGQKIQVEHIGTIYLSKTFVLSNALHIPNFSFNLISTSQLTNTKRHYVLLYYNHCFIQDLQTSKIIGLAKKVDGLYHLVQPQITADDSSVKIAASTFNLPVGNSQLWHYRLGHLSTPRL